MHAVELPASKWLHLLKRLTVRAPLILQAMEAWKCKQLLLHNLVMRGMHTHVRIKDGERWPTA